MYGKHLFCKVQLCILYAGTLFQSKEGYNTPIIIGYYFRDRPPLSSLRTAGRPEKNLYYGTIKVFFLHCMTISCLNILPSVLDIKKNKNKKKNFIFITL